MTEQLDGQSAQNKDFTPEQLHEIEVVELAIRDLWELKKVFDRHRAKDAKPLNFDSLLRKENYRNQVIEKLLLKYLEPGNIYNSF